jgi:hypothetical protein
MLTFLLILVAVDSIFALVVAYKEKWGLLGLACAIGIALNLLIKHLYHG